MHTSGNLSSRKDNMRGLTETFGYTDNLNRLNSYQVSGLSGLAVGYKPNGNIDTKTDAGTYTYLSAKPHGVQSVSNTANFPLLTQNVTYTPFNKPDKVTDGNYELQFTYGTEQQRKKSVLKNNGTVEKTIFYVGNYEKIIKGADTYEVHYIVAGPGLVAINVRKNNGAHELHYVYTDHLGSILTLTDANGNVEFEQNFDPWGRKRNPTNWTYTANPATQPAWLTRGFTGHEHHDEVSLINMNARMYDPVVARMLSPDNYVQDATGTQGLNRYSYVVNNPLRFTDPTGNDIFDDIFKPIINVLTFPGRLWAEGVSWLQDQTSGRTRPEGYFNWNYLAGSGTPYKISGNIIYGGVEHGDFYGQIGPRNFTSASGKEYEWDVINEFQVGPFINVTQKAIQYRTYSIYKWGYKEIGYGSTFMERLANLPKAIWEGDVFGNNDPNIISLTLADNPISWLMGGGASKVAGRVFGLERKR